MSESAHSVRHSYHEYLVLEATSNTKHEFLAGQIYAVAGGTPEHAAVAGNVVALLNAQLRGWLHGRGRRRALQRRQVRSALFGGRRPA